MVTDKHIAVLGAGPMGLAVAYQLVKDGYQPVVFEADDRVGGQAAAFDFDGLKIERFYHFHCISDKAVIDMLAELGLADKLHWVETKMGYYYQGKLQEWGNPLALLRFSGLSLIAKLRYGLHVFLATKRQNWRPLDKQFGTKWVKRWVGEEAYEVLWKRLLEHKFYEHTHTISAAWLWSRIHRLGRSRYDMFREKLGYIDGGSETLMNAMAGRIKAGGGEIRLGSGVSQVMIEAGEVIGVKVADEFYPFSKVVSTIPLPYVPKIMPKLPETILEKIRAIPSCAVVCVIVKLKKPVTDYFWINTNDSAMDIPGIIEYSNLRPMGEHIVYVPFYLPGDHPKFQDDDQIFIDKVRSYLKKVNPMLQDKDFIAIKASRYRHAQPVCGPYFLDCLPPVALPVKGLWAADTSYYYPDDRGISESFMFGMKIAKIAEMGH